MYCMSIRSIVYLIILYYVVREFRGKGEVFLVKVIDVKYPRLISALLDRSHLVIECVHAVTAAFAYYHHRHRFRHVCQARARIAILQISITAKKLSYDTQHHYLPINDDNNNQLQSKITNSHFEQKEKQNISRLNGLNAKYTNLKQRNKQLILNF